MERYDGERMDRKNFVEHELADMLKVANENIESVYYIPDFYEGIDECLLIRDEGGWDEFIDISELSLAEIARETIALLIYKSCDGMLVFDPEYENDYDAIHNFYENMDDDYR